MIVTMDQFKHKQSTVITRQKKQLLCTQFLVSIAESITWLVYINTNITNYKYTILYEPLHGSKKTIFASKTI